MSADSAKEYVEKNKLESLLSDAVVACIKERPKDPLPFLASYFDKKANSTVADFDALYPAFEAKMKADPSISQAGIDAFKYNFKVLTSGEDLSIPESTIKPVESLPIYEDLTAEKPELLKECIMVKLNGGLGTGMGLEKAKSLLELKDGNSFLDFIAKQTLHMREAFGTDLAFMLMNSFSTDDDTKAALAKYETLVLPGLELAFLQNKAPKVVKDDLSPATFAPDPEKEWCPPGHGDIYPALLGSKMLDVLLSKGFKYMFVSNSDNLGATMDLKLLTWFSDTGADFAMECATRTDADKKGGHLAAKLDGGLLLRESAQCNPEDEKEFQNVGKYKYFNTNNLWVNLEALKKAIVANDNALPLPVMKNGKTVDPRDKKSTKVLQLETAMGAAITCFANPAAICIPRNRFAPVKTTADMLGLMSDAYEVTDDHRMQLKAVRDGKPPTIKLDDAYKFVDKLKGLVPNGPPSLVGCKKLTVEGASVEFAAGVVFEGTVKVTNESGETKVLPTGTYKDTTIDLKDGMLTKLVAL